MNKPHGGKRANSGKTSGWGYPKGTPLRLIKLPVQIADALQAVKERMSGDDLIRLLNQDLNKLPVQEIGQIGDNLIKLPNQEPVAESAKQTGSGFKGVSRHKRSGKWQAQVRVNGKPKHLGLFDTPELASEAIKVYTAVPTDKAMR